MTPFALLIPPPLTTEVLGRAEERERTC